MSYVFIIIWLLLFLVIIYVCTTLKFLCIVFINYVVSNQPLANIYLFNEQ